MNFFVLSQNIERLYLKNRVAHNGLGIADGGVIYNVPPGQFEVQNNYKSLQFLQKFKRIPSAGTKANSEQKPIALTSRPTIGNTMLWAALVLH